MDSISSNRRNYYKRNNVVKILTIIQLNIFINVMQILDTYIAYKRVKRRGRGGEPTQVVWPSQPINT